MASTNLAGSTKEKIFNLRLELVENGYIVYENEISNGLNMSISNRLVFESLEALTEYLNINFKISN